MKPVVESVVQQAVGSPEYMRLPSRGRDPIFGLTRPWYYQRIQEGAIRSSCLRRKGALTGVRLVHIGSVRAYIEARVETSPKDKWAV